MSLNPCTFAIIALLSKLLCSKNPVLAKENSNSLMDHPPGPRMRGVGLIPFEAPFSYKIFLSLHAVVDKHVEVFDLSSFFAVLVSLLEIDVKVHILKRKQTHTSAASNILFANHGDIIAMLIPLLQVFDLHFASHLRLVALSEKNHPFVALKPVDSFQPLGFGDGTWVCDDCGLFIDVQNFPDGAGSLTGVSKIYQSQHSHRTGCSAIDKVCFPFQGLLFPPTMFGSLSPGSFLFVS